MITFKAIRDYIAPQLQNEVGVIAPGPDDPETSGSFIKITRTGGTGLEAEGILDLIEFQFDCVGLQYDYDSAESLALEVDRLVLGILGRTIGGVRVVSVWRSGSPPTPLEVDEAQRHHFACSYLWRVQSGL